MCSIPAMKLTNNFNLGEFKVSSNYADLAEQIEFNALDEYKAYVLAATILEPTRAFLGCPLEISSGKRSPLLNKVVGGVSDSEHRWKGWSCACDFVPKLIHPGFYKGIVRAYEFIRTELKYNFGQLIIYLDQDWKPINLHVSTVSQEHVAQVFVKKDGKYNLYSDEIMEKVKTE